MDYYYYILEGVMSSNLSDLKAGVRIFKFHESVIFLSPKNLLLPNLPVNFEDGEGPYESIRQLKDNSELFKALQRTDPGRAAKIFQAKYLIEVNEGQFAAYAKEDNEDFLDEVYPLLLHTITGKFTKDDVSGIHCFNPDMVRVVKLIGLDESNGVWQAYIEVLNPNTQKWVAKREPSTFFPRNWSYTRMLNECAHAHKHRVKISETKYKGITPSQVLVVFIYDDQQKLKTVFPICDEI